MNYKPLPVGVDNFEMLITRGYYFIDKTKMVQELVDKKISSWRMRLCVRKLQENITDIILSVKVMPCFQVRKRNI